MVGTDRRHPRCTRRTLQCSIHVLLLLVLLLTGVQASGSRVRSRKHRASRGTAPVARWQSRTSTELAVKPAPFSKPAHTGTSDGNGKMKRSYYGPTVTNLENNLHHFINNLKTGIGSSKLAHAVNGVTGALQQAVSLPGHGPVNLLSTHRPVHSAAGYYSNANELRYGQPFVSKQAGGHFKPSPNGFGKNGGKRGRHSSKASPPGKYDSLMSDLGISGYKHFENAVIRDLERREELKVEATIHTLFPEAGEDEWRPIAASKRPVVRNNAPELSESKIVTTLTAPAEKRPLESGVRSTKPKLPAVTGPPGGRYSTTGTSVSPKSTVAPGQKHRPKGSSLTKEKRTKDRPKCWNCINSTSTTISTRQPSVAHSTTARLPSVGPSSHRLSPTYDAAMFYGNDGKVPAAVAQSYSNVEIQYNRTVAPPFVVSPWTPASTSGGTAEEVSTQSAPPVTTYTALSESPQLSTVNGGSLSTFHPGNVKKSFSKAAKPYGPATSYQVQGDAAVTSATTHKPTGGLQGTKGTTAKKRTHHRPEGPGPVGGARRPIGKVPDSFGAGSNKNEVRVKKKFDPKYSRNRGTIKFKDALQKNPDQIYR